MHHSQLIHRAFDPWLLPVIEYVSNKQILFYSDNGILR
jgi:hypothetical protein